MVSICNTSKANPHPVNRAINRPEYTFAIGLRDHSRWNGEVFACNQRPQIHSTDIYTEFVSRYTTIWPTVVYIARNVSIYSKFVSIYSTFVSIYSTFVSIYSTFVSIYSTF